MLTAAAIEGRLLFPLSELLSVGAVPDDIAQVDRDTDSFLNSVCFADSSLQPVENGFLGTVVLVVLEEIVIAPFGNVAGLVIGGGGGVSVFEARVRLQQMPGGFRFEIGLYDVAVGLRISPSILRPLKPGTNEPEPPNVPLDIQLGAVSIVFGTDEPFRVTWSGSPYIPRCMIGESGIIISAGAIRWLTPFSEDLPADTPPDCLGMYLDNVGVELSNLEFDSNPSLFLDYAFIGRGGFTGRVDLQNLNLSGKLAGFTLTLQDFGLTIVQNSIMASNLAGRIEMPFFDQPVDVEIGINLDGSVAFKLARESGLYPLTKPGILIFELESLGFEYGHDLFTFKLSGEIKPLFGAPELEWPKFKVKELSIDSQGHVRLDGGWLNLREQKRLNFNGFQIEITKVGFGKTEDSGKWIGFSGSAKLVEGLPAGASVEGLRIIWYDDDSNRPPKVTFNGIGIEFAIPKVLEFKGAISYREPYTIPAQGGEEKVERIDGAIRLKLNSLDLEIDGKLVVGHVSGPRGDYNFFAIYVGVELPAGIPLFATGLGLYGFAGLFATQMEPNKRPEEGWYDNPNGDAGWYKRPDVGISDLAKKWDPQLGSLAFGIGATIGTLPDNGTSFHGKFLLVIVFPGPIVMLEGRGDLLKKRVLAVSLS